MEHTYSGIMKREKHGTQPFVSSYCLPSSCLSITRPRRPYDTNKQGKDLFKSVTMWADSYVSKLSIEGGRHAGWLAITEKRVQNALTVLIANGWKNRGEIL